MGDLEALMGQTKALMGDLITKPKMTDKLLSKPPFRFLHDTISAVVSTTGFGEGLYSGGELDCASITDKEAKLAYLEKIFLLVGICKGHLIDIRASKVVSGLEPENSNIFLIALAECAMDRDLDNEKAVRLCLDGAQPGKPPRRSSGGRAESKSSNEDRPTDESKSASNGRDGRDGGGAKEVESSRIPPEMDVIAPDRGRSRGGTRGGKPNVAAPDAGLGGGMGGAIAPRLDGEIERCDGTEAATMAMLGPLITRPKLSEKLLSKPPFRFLFDIVMEVIRATGFASGLYTPEESDSANVAEKEQKIAFLEKIIKVVGLQLNTLVVANPGKIIAGKDPQDTNNFLQLLSVAAKNLPDSTAAVRTVLGDAGGAPAPMAAPSVAASKPAQQQREVVEVEKEIEERPAPKPQRDVQGERMEMEPNYGRGRDNFSAAASSSGGNNNRDLVMAAEEKPNLQDNAGDDGADAGEKRSSRPSTAGRRPPRVKDGAKQVQSKDVAPAVKKTEGIIIDGQADEDEDDDVPDETRLADEVSAQPKGGSDVAGAGSKLVKDIMSRQAEQEVAGRTNIKAETEEEDGAKATAEAGGSGIRLGRLKKTGLDKKGAAGGAAAGSGFGESDLEKMRGSIQLLVQHTGPLGTCMDYIQEDVSLMTAELHRWEEDCRRYEIEYEEVKRKTKESLHPLKLELAEVNDQIFEVIAKISSAKAANARNDEKIQQILKLSATA